MIEIQNIWLTYNSLEHDNNQSITAQLVLVEGKYYMLPGINQKAYLAGESTYNFEF